MITENTTLDELIDKVLSRFVGMELELDDLLPIAKKIVFDQLEEQIDVMRSLVYSANLFIAKLEKEHKEFSYADGMISGYNARKIGYKVRIEMFEKLKTELLKELI